jgi:hypothetical protein
MRLLNGFKNERRAGGRRSCRPRTIAHTTIIDLDGSPPTIAIRPFRRGQTPGAEWSAGLRHGVVASRMRSPSGHSPRVTCGTPWALRQGMSLRVASTKQPPKPALTRQADPALDRCASLTKHSPGGTRIFHNHESPSTRLASRG